MIQVASIRIIYSEGMAFLNGLAVGKWPINLKPPFRNPI